VNAALRIALAYFQMLSLQRWFNLAGLLLLAAAAAVTLFGNGPGNAKTVFTLCTFAIVMILLIPGFGGGMAMRIASRPTVVHLRPGGRLKVLTGSTLAVTMLALIACIPSLAAHAYGALHQVDPRRFGQPLQLLAFFWGVAALGWIAMFATSRTMWLAVSFPLVPLAAMQMPLVFQRYPAFTPLHFFAIGLAAWVAFGSWYLRAERIRPPRQRRFADPAAGMGYQWLLSRKDELTADTPAKAIACYLLGTSSKRAHILTGIWTALIFVAVSFLTARAGAMRADLLAFMLPFLAVQCAVAGFVTARRARSLWLRNGLPRQGLFGLGEKHGLQSTMLTWGIVAVVAAACMIAAVPGEALQFLVYIAGQALFAACLFYLGMALVKNWSLSDVILCLAAVLLLAVQMAFAHPVNGLRDPQPTITLLAGAALLLPLRAWARHRWLGLDWRLVRPARLDPRRS
jgi:hypothetical protein